MAKTLFRGKVISPQHFSILQYVRTHKYITPMIAFRELGITKLATRISEMESADVEHFVHYYGFTDGKRNKYMSYKLKEV